MKRFFVILFTVILTFNLITFAFASDKPQITFAPNSDNKDSISIIVSDSANGLIQIYKTINNGKPVLYSTFSFEGKPYELKILFNELPCNINSDVTVYAVNSAGIQSDELKLSMKGPHKAGDWTITQKATCTEPGLSTCECAKCHQPISTKTLSALGHSWNDPTWTWAKDYSSATATFTCQRDAQHTYTLVDTAPVISNSTESTCTTSGSITYTAAVSFGNKTYSTTKNITTEKKEHTASDWVVEKKATCAETGIRFKTCTVCKAKITTEIIPATGHDYKITYKWNSDNTSCTATAVCTHDKTHTISETVKGVDEITAKASCTTLGKLTRTASFTNKLFTAQSKDAIITGSHVDANKDNICDTCKMKLSSDTAETTTQKNIFDGLFEKDTTSEENSSNTPTTAPTEVTTSIHFEEPSSNNDNQNVPQKAPRKMSHIIIAASFGLLVGIISLIVSILIIKKDKIKTLNKR